MGGNRIYRTDTTTVSQKCGNTKTRVTIYNEEGVFCELRVLQGGVQFRPKHSKTRRCMSWKQLMRAFGYSGRPDGRTSMVHQVTTVPVPENDLPEEDVI